MLYCVFMYVTKNMTTIIISPAKLYKNKRLNCPTKLMSSSALSG